MLPNACRPFCVAAWSASLFSFVVVCLFGVVRVLVVWSRKGGAGASAAQGTLLIAHCRALTHPPGEGGQSRQGRASSRRVTAHLRITKRPCCQGTVNETIVSSIASGRFVLDFCGAVGGGGCGATEAGPVQRQPHALRRNRRALGADGARVDARPGNLRRQPAIFDLRAAVHDDLEAGRFRLRGGCG